MSPSIVLLAVVASAFAGWRIYRRLRFFLHIHQLEGYRARPFLHWVAARPFDVVLRLSHLAGVAILMVLLLFGLPVAIVLLLWAVAFASSRRYRRDRPKKPLVLTARLMREAVSATLITGGLVLVTAWGIRAWAGPVPAISGAPVWLVGLLFGSVGADLMAPVSVWIAGLVMTPVEAFIRAGFKRAARAKLASRPDLTIIAVTGSYGKTSVKFAIAEVLAQRYQVLATPGSFNTPMGICKVINNDLRDHHQMLILEMGIRHPGDIAELCAIASPDIAVITGIGIAHLESMGSKDAIAQEKGGLIDFLRPGGRAVLNADDDFYPQMAGRGAVTSVSSEGGQADLQASEVNFGPEGTSFVVAGPAPDSGLGIDHMQRARVDMRLLGRHHVGNALLALGVGHLLGIRLRSGARALSRQAPVSHRLSIREEDGLLILDDAFNSNPVGAQNAVEVLEQFSPRRRFIVTPGMIELGEMEYEANQALGAYMVGRVDDAILVGRTRTAAIADGLAENRMASEHIHVVSTLFEARETIAKLAKPGDVVLFENDLPDQYTEA